MLPITPPSTRKPIVHPSSEPRFSRQASASGLRRLGRASARPGRAGSTNGSSNGHQCRSPNGRTFCTQPIGDSHDSQDGPDSPAASPAARSRKDAASTVAVIALAVRENSVSCAAIAAIAANTQPMVA